MFWGSNLCQAKSGVISFSVIMGGGGGGVSRVKKNKVAQNDLKHNLVLGFLKSNEIFEFVCELTSKQGNNHTYATVTR